MNKSRGLINILLITPVATIEVEVKLYAEIYRNIRIGNGSETICRNIRIGSGSETICRHVKIGSGRESICRNITIGSGSESICRNIYIYYGHAVVATHRNCFLLHTSPKFNSSPLKNDGWKTMRLPFGARTIFRGKLAEKTSREYFDVFWWFLDKVNNSPLLKLLVLGGIGSWERFPRSSHDTSPLLRTRFPTMRRSGCLWRTLGTHLKDVWQL